MKTNTELRASLSMVLARLDSDPTSSSEWQAMDAALVQSLAYVRKTKELHAFVERTRQAPPRPPDVATPTVDELYWPDIDDD